MTAETAETAETTQPVKSAREGRPVGASPALGGGVSAARPYQVSLYWWDEVREDVRAAYVYDYNTRDDCPPGFDAWVGEACRLHAALSPATRHHRASTLPLPEGDRRINKVRADAATIEAIDRGLREDSLAGHDRSTSGTGRNGFVIEACRLAAAAIRERAGRPLPPAPARLPIRPRIGR